MFTTGNHGYLYASCGLYAVALVLSLAARRRTPALAAVAVGFVVHGLYLAGRGWLSGVFYANPIFEGPFFLPWCVAGIVLFASVRRRERPTAPLIGLLLVLCLGAVAYSKGVIPPSPKKMNALAPVFFFAENLGHALFYCGAVMAVRGMARGERENGYHRFLVWGFVFFSVSQVIGAAWCYVGWGNTFRWSPRHFTSAALWVMYAAYLHLRFTPGWSGKKRSVFAIVAAVLTFLATYGHYLRELAFARVGG